MNTTGQIKERSTNKDKEVQVPSCSLEEGEEARARGPKQSGRTRTGITWPPTISEEQEREEGIERTVREGEQVDAT